jgi:hypothetical protein
MRAKYFKILSHRVFPKGRPSLRLTFPFGLRRQIARYDYLIWIDGSAVVKRRDFVETVVSCIGASGWAMFSHPDRTCIYDEAEASVGMPKYASQPIMAQVDHYRGEGYPAGNALMAAGVIARDARRLDLATINEMWWRENLRWSYQDQLSLPVVLWRLGCRCDIIEGNLWRNSLVEWTTHKVRRRRGE